MFKTAITSPVIFLRFLQLLPGIYRSSPSGRYTVVDVLEKRAAAGGDAVFLRFEGSEWTYADVNARANQVAHWALERGLGRDSVVGLLMSNRPDYLATWLGLAKVGAVAALLNTNLRGTALSHCLRAASCNLLVLGSECAEAWDSTLGDRPEIEVYTLPDPGAEASEIPAGSHSLDEEIGRRETGNPVRPAGQGFRGSDPLFYIFTSGTTGLPKAARLSHSRFMGGGIYASLAGMKSSDVFYCPLPLYHTSGGVMCVSAVMNKGATLALARRFSASRFWDEVVASKATAFQYIGELCRYLANRPEDPLERSHSLRLAVGNGLLPDVWDTMLNRFGIDRVVEFYGATESNAAMVNLANRVGSVGRPFPGAKIALVRHDAESSEATRGPDGRCQPCAPGEIGELLVQIFESHSAVGSFEGYTSKEATEKKILRDVFKPGDTWFCTGDLLYRDQDGFYYFVDRVGDTFRWKGENVSTLEVAEAVLAFPGVEVCAAYGVKLPETEGRAGMAAVVLEQGASLDGEKLFCSLTRALPGYAVPAFIRIREDVELTGTFKLRKVELQKEGFDPDTVTDQILYRDDTAGAFLPLDSDAFSRIQAAELHF